MLLSTYTTLFWAKAEMPKNKVNNNDRLDRDAIHRPAFAILIRLIPLGFLRFLASGGFRTKAKPKKRSGRKASGQET
jgi:hypothetical protein